MYSFIRNKILLFSPSCQLADCVEEGIVETKVRFLYFITRYCFATCDFVVKRLK